MQFVGACMPLRGCLRSVGVKSGKSGLVLGGPPVASLLGGDTLEGFGRTQMRRDASVYAGCACNIAKI